MRLKSQKERNLKHVLQKRIKRTLEPCVIHLPFTIKYFKIHMKYIFAIYLLVEYVILI